MLSLLKISTLAFGCFMDSFIAFSFDNNIIISFHSLPKVIHKQNPFFIYLFIIYKYALYYNK